MDQYISDMYISFGAMDRADKDKYLLKIKTLGKFRVCEFEETEAFNVERVVVIGSKPTNKVFAGIARGCWLLRYSSV